MDLCRRHLNNGHFNGTAAGHRESRACVQLCVHTCLYFQQLCASSIGFWPHAQKISSPNSQQLAIVWVCILKASAPHRFQTPFLHDTASCFAPPNTSTMATAKQRICCDYTNLRASTGWKESLLCGKWKFPLWCTNPQNTSTTLQRQN